MKKHRAVMENDRRGALKNWPRFEKSRTVWVGHFFMIPVVCPRFQEIDALLAKHGKRWFCCVLFHKGIDGYLGSHCG